MSDRKPKLYKPRSSNSIAAKLFFTPAQHHRAGMLAAHYADLMGQEVSKSVIFARALDLFADHLEAQLSTLSREAVREAEKAALLRSLL
jgi:hypothetical protein